MSGASGDWIDQYTSALTARDASEQAHKHYIDAYTRLADHTAASHRPSHIEQEGQKARTPNLSGPVPDDGVVDQLRADLGATQKARTALATQVDDLTASVAVLQTQKKEHLSHLAVLSRQKLEIERKLRDRDEELRGKLRLVQESQDEMIALELQLYMVEQKKEVLEKENKDLVDRWMKRVGEEADQVNRTSKWS